MHLYTNLGSVLFRAGRYPQTESAYLRALGLATEIYGDGEDEAVAIFSVDGMTCEGCALGMKATIEREPGVKLAEVDYETETASIRFDQSQTSAERLIAAIAELGYTAKLTEPAREG